MTVIAPTIAPCLAAGVVRAGRIAVRRAASRVKDGIRETASTESTSRGRQSYFLAKRRAGFVTLDGAGPDATLAWSEGALEK